MFVDSSMPPHRERDIWLIFYYMSYEKYVYIFPWDFISMFRFWCRYITCRCHLGLPKVTVARQSDWALFTLGHPKVTVARQSDSALFTLGHPKVTVARQSDWALFTLGHPRVTVARQSDLALFTLGHPRVTVARQSDWTHPWTLTVAAPGHYSRYWAYSADHHKLLLIWFWFVCNKFVNILNTQVLSHSARRTRLLWPLKLNHYISQWSMFIWRNSQRDPHTFHTLYSEIFKLSLARVQIVKCKRTWSDLDAGIWMYPLLYRFIRSCTSSSAPVVLWSRAEWPHHSTTDEGWWIMMLIKMPQSLFPSNAADWRCREGLCGFA
jgi:hypothetical protein